MRLVEPSTREFRSALSPGTPAVKLNRERRQRLELLGEMCGNVAHDMSNVLAVIMTMAESMQDQVEPLSPLREDLDLLLEAADHGKRLSQRLLATVGDEPTEPTRHDLSTLVQEVGPLIRLVRPRVIISYSFSETPLPVRVDAQDLHHVLMNLVFNARDAMPQGGSLRIATHRAPEGAVLTVEDTGCGIARESITSIFEPGYSKKEPRGSGWGLSSSASAVQRMGGCIDVVSEVGEGTRFDVTIPFDA